MLKVVEIGLSPISCLLYEKSLVDVNHFLATRSVLLDMSCILGHAWPIIALPLYAPVEAYIVIGTGRVVNLFELFFRFCF